MTWCEDEPQNSLRSHRGEPPLQLTVSDTICITTRGRGSALYLLDAEGRMERYQTIVFGRVPGDSVLVSAASVFFSRSQCGCTIIPPRWSHFGCLNPVADCLHCPGDHEAEHQRVITVVQSDTSRAMGGTVLVEVTEGAAVIQAP